MLWYLPAKFGCTVIEYQIKSNFAKEILFIYTYSMIMKDMSTELWGIKRYRYRTGT